MDMRAKRKRFVMKRRENRKVSAFYSVLKIVLDIYPIGVYIKYS